ncbi:XRE family transcriptional regulator [Solwaraspora sp. WMMA2080]|uniref:XRE family transcriptional regulator n=1 Tax=unclassified Solwaraspora TaxID=2627926 RepID=UPI00248C48E1|nr:MULTISPECIES: XRE family transcriptional regulator [unclassified Solwaraspora]WBB97180.1 XRE family transcriptional regulator [Solwaraspora sp. WMMA2059]WBC18918.1 XRE family transcriptional regulator [Solwaraspora sp. WMMA2080]
MRDELEEDSRPAWAQRLRSERTARGWSQSDAVRALRAHASEPLPSDIALLRNWKRWEAGSSEPDVFYKTLIAKTYGTVTAAFFPRQGGANIEADLLADSGLETLEILSRIRASDVSAAMLDALRIAADRLCCEYPYTPPYQLYVEGKAWLRRLMSLMDRRLTLAQHKEVLSLAGLVALLVGCVEYDLGLRREAESTRKAALALGEEAGDAAVVGWAHEMRAWYALTQGDYRGTIAAADIGVTKVPGQSVAVQLAAQQAKAWARIGDRRKVETALDRGRSLLESLPYPEDTDHHFVVDPSKFDFYAMDCYRLAREDQLAEIYAHEVIRSSTDPDGTERKPMRNAEARLTLGVVAARRGEIQEAVAYGRQALSGDRRSLPSLLMCSRELGQLLQEQYPKHPEALAFLDELRVLSSPAGPR